MNPSKRSEEKKRKKKRKKRLTIDEIRNKTAVTLTKRPVKRIFFHIGLS